MEEKPPNADQEILSDLWIQAITYFCTLDSRIGEEFLKKALSKIASVTEYEIIAPYLVLELLQSKPNLKFSVMKEYMLTKLKHQDESVK